MSIRRSPTQVGDLEESLATLSVLEENLKKTDQITQKMATLLTTVFDARLGKLEKNIKPMYNTTRNLTLISQNIDATIAAVDNMKKNFDIVPAEEQIINAGPKQNIQEYLASITRLQNSLNTLSRSNLRSADNVQAQMTKLVKLGVSQLDDVFRRTLMTHSKVIDPTLYLNQDTPFPKLPPQPLQLLSTLADFFVSLPNLQTQHTQIYADIRGGYLSNSLSDISAGVISSAQGRRDVPSITPGTFISASISMLECETETINSIFQGLVQQEEIFEKTASAPMGLFSRTFKALNTQIRSSPSQNLPLTLSILDDLTFAQDMVSRSTVSSGSVEVLRKEINTLEREGKGVGAVGVGDVVEDVRRRGQGVLSLPSDGGIIDLTTDTMTRLASLIQYSRPLTQLLLSLPSGSWNRQDSLATSTLPPFNLDTDSRAILARWAMDVIDTLTSVLESKSKTLLRPKSSLAASLFILNNLSEVEKRIRADRMLQNVIGSISAAEKERDQAKRGSRTSTGSNPAASAFSMPKSFEKAKRAGLDGYLDGYKDAVGHLLDVTYIKGGNNRSSGSLSGKEREAVKERFRNFNTEFEEIIRVNRGLSVPDPDVRGLVIGEIKRVVMPLYVRFYDKHSQSDFTKHTSKYIRWNKNQLDGVISRLFEGGSTSAGSSASGMRN